MDTNLDLGDYIFNKLEEHGQIDQVFQVFLRKTTTDALDISLLESENFDKLNAQI
jgi:hypothetical protein